MSDCPALIQWYNNISGFFFFFDLGVCCCKEKTVRHPTSFTVSDKAFPTRPLYREGLKAQMKPLTWVMLPTQCNAEEEFKDNNQGPPWWERSLVTVQGAWVPSLVRELALTCCNQDPTSCNQDPTSHSQELAELKKIKTLSQAPSLSLLWTMGPQGGMELSARSYKLPTSCYQAGRRGQI